MLSRLRETDKALGMRLLNRPTGVLGGPLAAARLWAARQRSSIQADSDLIQSVEDTGYRCGQLFDAETMDRIQEAVVPQLSDDEAATVNRVNGTEVFRSIGLNPATDETVQMIVSHAAVQKLLQRYFGTRFQPSFSAVLRYEHLPPANQELVVEHGHTRNWHIDTSDNPNAVRLLVFLTDQTKHGALEVVSSSGTRNLLDQFNYEELEEHPHLVEEHATINTFHGQRGSGVLFNPVTQLHRGGGPDAGKARTVLLLSFLPT